MPGGAGGPTVIDVGVGDAEEQGSATEQWLAQFHEGLAAGRTAGVVVERYRRPPGDPPDLATDHGPLPPARAAALPGFGC